MRQGEERERELLKGKKKKKKEPEAQGDSSFFYLKDLAACAHFSLWRSDFSSKNSWRVLTKARIS